MTARSRRTWISIAWTLAVFATVINGIVVGYGAIWFQLFGDSADAEDYRVSAGGYGAAAGVLVLAVAAILTHRCPRWLAWVAGVSALVLGGLAAASIGSIAGAEEPAVSTDTAWDGVGAVLWAPWTWALVALGIHGLFRLGRSADDRREEPGHPDA